MKTTIQLLSILVAIAISYYVGNRNANVDEYHALQQLASQTKYWQQRSELWCNAYYQLKNRPVPPPAQ
jgi:hypothetical protein